jgi:cholesterol transport system auxiliary component
MRYRLLPVLMVLPLAAGCISLAKDYPERRLHAIAAGRPGEPGAAAAGVVLSVRPLTVASRYEGIEFVYRTSEHGWESDFYNAFFVPPREALTDEVRGWLSAAGVASSFVDGSSAVPPTHLLEANVSSLYADVRSPGALKAVVEMEVMLVDDRSVPPAAVLTRRYAQSIAMAEDTPEALVAAWSAGLAGILAGLEKDLLEALAAGK